MSDQSNRPPYQVVRDALFEAMTRALRSEAVGGALDNLERTVFDIGYDRGFNSGWDAAVRRFTAVMESKPEPATAASIEPMELARARQGEQSTKDLVLSLIRRLPGLRGVEIVETAAKAGHQLNERTVRTALHRLKTSEQVRNEDGRWFANENPAP